MKSKIVSFFTFLVLCVVLFSLQSCSEQKYTVWTDAVSAADFEAAYGYSIPSGRYATIPISNDDWKEISKSLGRDGRHRWDEATIKKWLMSIGFGDAESTKEAAWFVLNDHGMLASNSGGTIYFLFK